MNAFFMLKTGSASSTTIAIKMDIIKIESRSSDIYVNFRHVYEWKEFFRELNVCRNKIGKSLFQCSPSDQGCLEQRNG